MDRQSRSPSGGGGVQPNRRERARAATVEEIKQTAFALMRETGTTDIRFADIARVMGLTAPALYRYFADRDELFSALVVDTYDALGAQVAAAREAVAPTDLGRQLLASCEAYRGWAVANPERFALIFSMPGEPPPTHGPTWEAAMRTMANLQLLVVAARELGQLRPPLVTEVGAAFGACAVEKAAELGLPIPPDWYQAMLQIWTAAHGFTCLEVYGQLNMMPKEARDELFLAQVRSTSLACGLPAPPAPARLWSPAADEEAAPAG